MVCDLFQGNTLSSTHFHWDPMSFWIPVMLFCVPHFLVWAPGPSENHPQDSPDSEWAVFLTMPTLRNRFPQNLSLGILQVSNNNFWRFTMSNAEWTPKDIYNILRVYITKLGWAYSMKVLFVLKWKRGGKKRWGEGRKWEEGEEIWQLNMRNQLTWNAPNGVTRGFLGRQTG